MTNSLFTKRIEISFQKTVSSETKNDQFVFQFHFQEASCFINLSWITFMYH
jgi:hypothetical protein